MMKRFMMMCAIVIAVAGLAGAAPTTLITFDEFPLGTLIDTEYAPLGVVFLPGDVTPSLPQISMNGAMPDQPVLRPTGEALPGYPTVGYIFQGDFWMQFTTPATEVQFDSGWWDTLGTGVINVYNPAMNPLASLTNTVTGVDTISISGLGPVGYIYFNSIADGAGADIDNLGFSPIPAPGAIVLGSIGVGLIGWLRRRRTL
jgi:hypothetical protein